VENGLIRSHKALSKNEFRTSKDFQKDLKQVSHALDFQLKREQVIRTEQEERERK
jgi:hypothetical protein